MDSIGNNRFGASSPFTPESTASAPPPPSEVKVRTMRSDLAAMAKSGGGLPRFENVKVTGLSAARAAATAAQKGANAAPKKKTNILIWFAVVAAIAAIGVLGYIGYGMFFANKGGTVPTPTPSAPSSPVVAATSSQSSTVASGVTMGASSTTLAPITPFTHVSLFKEPADQALTFILSTSTSATSSALLLSFNQKLSTLLATAKKTSVMIEVDAQDGSGNAMSIENLLAQANETVLQPSFLAENFNPDATFFVYRDKNGSWPGYVLSLQTGKNWLFLQSDVAELESSPAVANFFLTNPGAPSADGFTSSLIASTTVRILPFLTTSVPTYFVYGWSNGDLILSTSQSGFAAAVAHLGAQ